MEKSFGAFSIAMAVIMLSIITCISLTPGPLYAQVVLLPSYGQGKINVRVYTDYFCGPCRAGEPKIEALISDLVKANKIRLTFVDTPGHRETTLYVQYFLYALNNKKGFEHALLVRRALFDAASIKIITKDKLEEFLTQKGIEFKPFDAKPKLNAMNQYLRDDGVKNTPTIVIDNDSQKQQFSGVDSIVKALELLR